MMMGGGGGGGLSVLGCQVDILGLGTNCNKLLKLKIKGVGGRFSTSNHVGGAARRLLLVKKTFCR